MILNFKQNLNGSNNIYFIESTQSIPGYNFCIYSLYASDDHLPDCFICSSDQPHLAAADAAPNLKLCDV